MKKFRDYCERNFFKFISLKTIRVMKLTLILSMVAVIQLWATETYSQLTHITLKLDDVTICNALKEIENQSEFFFLYSPKLIDVEKRVNINAENETIKDILTGIFDKKVKFAAYDRQVILTPNEQSEVLSKLQQQKIITGTVADKNGPIPGANVVVTGTTTGTITDFNGKYTIEVPQGGKSLTFTFIGMESQEISIGTLTTIDVTMAESAIGLEEVIVIGYGSSTRKEITGSVSQTSGAELKISPAVSLSGSLAGRLAGVTINQRNGEPGRDEATILIRGINTTGISSPLIVIDGIADRDGISRLDPEDISTVTVLKDASASIYGARAANGVILVTTKRGVEGKPAITYSFNQGYVQPTRLPLMADAGTYAQALYDAETNIGSVDHMYSLEDIQKFKDGSSPLTHPNSNWYGDLFKDISLQSRHNISMRGGTNSVKYFLSLGTTNQDGLYTEGKTQYKQYNFRANVDTKITENFKMGFDLSVRKENRQWPGYAQGFIHWLTLRQAPTEMAIFPNGEYSAGLASINPLALVRDSGYDLLNQDIYNGTISFDYKIPKLTGLSVDGFAAVDNLSSFGKNLVTPWKYSTFDPATNAYQQFWTTYQANTTLRETFNKSLSLTMNIKLKYAKTFKKHNLNVFVAYEQNTGNGDNFWAARNYFDSPLIDQLFAGTSDKSYWGNSGSGYQTARQNYFGRFSYSFADKYLLVFNARYDGSMNFPKNQRFGLFPGLSAGWRISEEAFFKQIQFINDLKIRASIGKLGNDRIESFSYLRKFGFGNNYVFGGKDVSGIYETNVSIPNVTWETTIVRNLGLDITMLKNKINMELDVFKNKTIDMLISRNLAIPSYAGFSPPPENAGEMQNKGMEMTLSYSDHFGQIGFIASGNISYAKNKVLYIDEVVNPDAPWQAQTGYKLNRRLVYDVTGIYRSQADLDKYPHLIGSSLGDLIYRDVDNNGVLNGLDMIPNELNETPEVVFGFNMGLTYKDFDLNAFFQGQTRANTPVGYRFNFTGNVEQEQLSNYYSEKNPNGTNPRPGLDNNYWSYIKSNFWLQNASFVRLKTLELGYNLPKSILSKIRFEELRAYISGYNLFTLSPIKVQDPEVTSSEGSQHPQTKVYNIGLKVTF